MTLAAQDSWTEAAKTLYEEHPFPSTLGRSARTLRKQMRPRSYDGAVPINAIERLAGDRGRSAAGFIARRLRRPRPWR